MSEKLLAIERVSRVQISQLVLLVFSIMFMVTIEQSLNV
jgi:hypothetical protein